MKIETREKFPNFVGFVSEVDLTKELNDKLVKKIDEAINKSPGMTFLESPTTPNTLTGGKPG